MEECDGGYGASVGAKDLRKLLRNKQLGGKRTNPQMDSEIQKFPKYNCLQCDFISQNEIMFNEHLTKAHAGQPTCPFCFIAFIDYPSIRKCQDLQEKSLPSEQHLLKV